MADCSYNRFMNSFSLHYPKGFDFNHLVGEEILAVAKSAVSFGAESPAVQQYLMGMFAIQLELCFLMKHHSKSQ